MTVRFISNPEQPKSLEPSTSSRLTQQKTDSGYIDVIYVDGKNPEEPKHFGNLQIEPGKEVKVYGIQNLMKVKIEQLRCFWH